MRKHIERLRKRSEEERKKIATIFAGIATFIIVILWVLILVFIKPDSTKTKDSISSLKKEIMSIFETSPKPDLEIDACSIEVPLEDALTENKDKTL